MSEDKDPIILVDGAPPRANPLTVFSAAIEEKCLSDVGVSNNAIRFTSGKDDMDELSSTFGNIKAFTPNRAPHAGLKPNGDPVVAAKSISETIGRSIKTT